MTAFEPTQNIGKLLSDRVNDILRCESFQWNHFHFQLVLTDVDHLELSHADGAQHRVDDDGGAQHLPAALIAAQMDLATLPAEDLHRRKDTAAGARFM